MAEEKPEKAKSQTKGKARASKPKADKPKADKTKADKAKAPRRTRKPAAASSAPVAPSRPSSARRRDSDEPAREGKAVAKYIRISAFKARRSADIIRGKPLPEARKELAFSSLRSSGLVSKVLESAVANATNNLGLPEDRLYVHRAFVDEGLTLKRLRPRAYGRAYRIRKRTSHITVVVRAHDEER